jgi:hypothetical protein
MEKHKSTVMGLESMSRRKFDLFLVFLVAFLSIFGSIIGSIVTNYMLKDNSPELQLHTSNNFLDYNISINNLKENIADGVQVGYKVLGIDYSGEHYYYPTISINNPQFFIIHRNIFEEQISNYFWNVLLKQQNSNVTFKNGPIYLCNNSSIKRPSFCQEKMGDSYKQYSILISYYCNNCKEKDMQDKIKQINIECELTCFKNSSIKCFTNCGNSNYLP